MDSKKRKSEKEWQCWCERALKQDGGDEQVGRRAPSNLSVAFGVSV